MSRSSGCRDRIEFDGWVWEKFPRGDLGSNLPKEASYTLPSSHCTPDSATIDGADPKDAVLGSITEYSDFGSRCYNFLLLLFGPLPWVEVSCT